MHARRVFLGLRIPLDLLRCGIRVHGSEDAVVESKRAVVDCDGALKSAFQVVRGTGKGGIPRKAVSIFDRSKIPVLGEYRAAKFFLGRGEGRVESYGDRGQ